MRVTMGQKMSSEFLSKTVDILGSLMEAHGLLPLEFEERATLEEHGFESVWADTLAFGPPFVEIGAERKPGGVTTYYVVEFQQPLERFATPNEAVATFATRSSR